MNSSFLKGKKQNIGYEEPSMNKQTYEWNNKESEEIDNERKLSKIKFRYDQVQWWSLKLGRVSTAGESSLNSLDW